MRERGPWEIFVVEWTDGELEMWRGEGATTEARRAHVAAKASTCAKAVSRIFAPGWQGTRPPFASRHLALTEDRKGVREMTAAEKDVKDAPARAEAKRRALRDLVADRHAAQALSEDTGTLDSRIALLVSEIRALEKKK